MEKTAKKSSKTTMTILEMNELPVLIFLVRAFLGAALVFLANLYSFHFTTGPENSFAEYSLYRELIRMGIIC